MPIASINPATGKTLETFESLTEQQLEAKLQKASEAFRIYSRLSIGDRAQLMLKAGQILENEKREFARLMTIEMGKPIKSAVQEVEKCSWVCRYYAENGAQHLADEMVE